MIPEAKRDGVARALRETFGGGASSPSAEVEDIRMLTAGLSPALVFRIVVRGRPYLLRVITRTDAMNDPTRQFECMRSAADAGLAPRVWYTSIEDRISITDFVEARPFTRTEALARMPRTLRKLHGLAPFPKAVNYLDVADGYIRKFQAAGILPESETAELFSLYAPLAKVYPRDDSDMVPCHNDLKPENILFDGERVWLVDWEAAFANDRYVDLAVVANFVVTDDGEEQGYLASYFGEAAGSYRSARFYLMSQIVHIFYAVVFMFLGSKGKPIEPLHTKVPDFRDFHERIRGGGVSLAGDESKVEYGRVHMNQVLQNLRGVRFREAMRIVAMGR